MQNGLSSVQCPESLETPRAANKPTIETDDLVQYGPIQFMLCNQGICWKNIIVCQTMTSMLTIYDH